MKKKATKAKKVIKKPTVKIDSIQNVITGLNTAKKDKRVNVNVSPDILTQQEAENLYVADATARKIVDRVPEEGVRKWFEIYNVTPEVRNKFDKIFSDLELKTAITKAWIDARLYGGSALFINIDDGRSLEKEIDYKNIKKINSILCFNRYELFPTTNINKDIKSSNFGMPEEYTLSSSNAYENIKIHHSRLIRFDGNPLPNRFFISNNYWHDSILSSLYNPIINYSQTHDSIASLMQDFRQRIMKINDLALMLSNDEENLLTKRMEMQDLIKSIFKTDLMDSEDQLEILSTPLDGVRDVLELINHRLVAATNMPHTIVLGQSPKGVLNNNAEHQNRNWYDHVSNQQEDVLRKPIQKIINLIMLAKEGATNSVIDENLTFVFNPLWQHSDTEEAELQKTVAEKDKIYYEMNVLTSEDIRNNRFKGNEFSLDTVLSESPPQKDQPLTNNE